MKKKKILITFGTRPEAIKMVPVVIQLKKFPDEFDTKIVTTGQHREMLAQVLSIFSITPDYNLNLMTDNQTLNGLAHKTLKTFSRVMVQEKADLVLVQGDTTTAFITGLCSYYNKVRVGHVEAGLRTGDKYNPYPEEINRRLLGVIADIHFAPTQRNKENLLREGVREDTIFVTGNTVIDALLMTVKEDFKRWPSFFEGIDFNKRLILVTAHRRESFGKPLENICQALKLLVELHEDIEIVYPVHLNPNVQQVAKKILNNIERVHLIPPLDYEIFVQLMNKSYLILTDSGGVQEEAPSLRKPVLVLRRLTERIEAFEAGTVKMVGTEIEKIIQEVEQLLNKDELYKAMAAIENPYGDGHAAERIVNWLKVYVKQFDLS